MGQTMATANTLVSSFLMTIIFFYAICERKIDSNLAGPILATATAAFVSAQAFCLGGAYNPIRTIGGFFITTLHVNQMAMMIVPFFGAVLGQFMYKYVLAGEDLMAIFEEDEEAT